MNGEVFLGGTCNGSLWRNNFIKLLKVSWFNPVVDNWTEEDYQKELVKRETCAVCLYVLTPKMGGVYSVAEVVDDSNKRPDKTVLLIIEEDDGKQFDGVMKKSLAALGKMIEANGGTFFSDAAECADYINNKIADSVH